jgi:rhodanese-related sulfurtransferase
MSRSQPTRRFHLPSALRPSDLRIEPDEARELLAGERGLLIDVRRQDDPAQAIPGALRVTPDAIPAHVPEFPRDVPIVLACT